MKDYSRYGKRSSKSLVRKKTASAKLSSLKLGFTWILMIIAALFFVQQRLSYIRTEKSVKTLMGEKDQLQLSILPLKLEERFLTQHDQIERSARAEFGLQVPRKVQVITVQVNKNPSDDETVGLSENQ